MTLAADEFIRRFLIHVLPPGFQRIRHFGFLANRFRKEKLALCRKLLAAPVTELLPGVAQCLLLLALLAAATYVACPKCWASGLLRTVILPQVIMKRALITGHRIAPEAATGDVRSARPYTR